MPIIANLYIRPFRPELIALRVFELQARLGLQGLHFHGSDFSWKARSAHCTHLHTHSIHLEHLHDSKIFYEHVMLTLLWLWLV